MTRPEIFAMAVFVHKAGINPWDETVIASEAKQSLYGMRDCFASLAMTVGATAVYSLLFIFHFQTRYPILWDGNWGSCSFAVAVGVLYAQSSLFVSTCGVQDFRT